MSQITEKEQGIKLRCSMVQMLYRFFITNKTVDNIKQEVLDNFQLEYVTDINKDDIILVFDNMEDLKERLEKHLNINWSWERLPKIIKSILLTSAFEKLILKKDKAIIINEAIELTRMYSPGWDTKFINAILDKVE